MDSRAEVLLRELGARYHKHYRRARGWLILQPKPFRVMNLDSYYATVQIAEGAPEPPVVVKVEVKGSSIEFTLGYFRSEPWPIYRKNFYPRLSSSARLSNSLRCCAAIGESRSSCSRPRPVLVSSCARKLRPQLIAKACSELATAVRSFTNLCR